MLWMKLLERHDCEYITSQHRGHVLPKIELLQCGCQRAASCRLDFTCHAGLTCCNIQCNAREQLTQVSFESFAAGQPCTQPCCGMFSICAIGMTREAMQAVTDNWVARQCFHYTNVCQASSLTVTVTLKPCQLCQKGQSSRPFADRLAFVGSGTQRKPC